MRNKLRIFVLIYILWNTVALGGDDRDIYELHIKDHKFYPEELHIKADRKIKLIVFNDDDTVEEFESIDLKREKIIAPHSKISLLIGPMKPGEYRFFGDFHQKTAQGKIVVD